MISLAPGATVTSPVTWCIPIQVSVPVIVPWDVSLEATAVLAGSAIVSRMLIKNNPVKENELALPSAAISLGVIGPI